MNEGATLTKDAASGVLSNDEDGADGFAASAVVGVAAGSDTSNPVSGQVGTQINGTWGKLTLNADGSYTYTSTANAITKAETDTFVYTVVDGDGDLSTTTLTINLTNSGLMAPDDDEVLVYEKALDLNQDGSDLAPGIVTGSIPSDTGETDAVNQLNATGGFGTLTYALADGESAVGDYGTIQINSDGSYTYTLTKPYDTDPAANNGANEEENRDSFTYKVTDANGNTTTGTIYVDIVDDTPTAYADSGSVNEGATLTKDAASGVLSNDEDGADGFAASAVVGVAAGSDTSNPVSGQVGTQINGTWGKLTLNADGSYTYTSTANAITKAETDTFVYTVVDGDGDLSTTTLTINLTNSGLMAPDDDEVLVYEKALDLNQDGSDLAPGIVTGSIPSDTGETDAVNQLNATGGFGTLTYALADGESAVGDYGTIQINSDGSYTYTLTKPYDTDPAANNGANEEENRDSFTYKVTDANGNTTTGTIYVDIVDDTPTAIDPDYAFMRNVAGASATGIALDVDSNIDNNVGADQPGALTFTAANQSLYNGYTSLGSPIYLYVSTDGKTLIGSTYATGVNAADANVLSAKVFTVQLNLDGSFATENDTYAFSLHKPIDGGQTTFNVQDAGYDFQGGNDPYSYFNDTITNDLNGDQDVLLTPMINGLSDGTTNTSNIAGGVGGGNSIGSGEGLRVDYVNGIAGDPAKNVNDDYSNTANWDHTFTGHNNVNGASVVITSTSGSTVRVRAFDDTDTDNVVGDGTQDNITRVVIGYNGDSQSFVITDGMSAITDTIGGRSFTITEDGLGVLVAGVQGGGGDTPSLYTTITVFTETGLSSVDYTWAAGDTFKVGGFGAAVSIPGEVIELQFDLALTDGDGDIVALPDALKVVLSPEAHDLYTGNDGDNLMDYSSNVDPVTLVGFDGNDTLVGTHGNDILMGGPGDDTLTGGDSGDTFKFLQGDLGHGVDTITDFEVGGGDVLDLADLFETPPAGLLSDYVKIDNVSIAGSSTTVDLSVDVDGAGAAAPVHVATVTMTGLDPAADTAAEILTAIESQIKTEMP